VHVQIQSALRQSVNLFSLVKFLEYRNSGGIICLKTPIRRLDGIAYWVIEDPDGIHDFVNNELRKEWEEDARTEHRDPREETWLKTLSKRQWRLRAVDIDRIKLDQQIMDFGDAEERYVFKESLAKRSRELKETVERFAVVIWPQAVKAEDFMLVDGYCRYTALKALNISRTYAYVGSLPNLVTKSP
jgi:hypothetical protein